MKGFLEYVDGDGILHRLNPLTKIFIAVCICAASFVSNNLFFLCGLVLLNLLIGAVGGVMKQTFRMFCGLAKISLFILILQLLFVRSGDTVFTVPLVNFDVTDNGIFTGIRAALRLTAATMPLSSLLLVTKVGDISNALVKNLGVPYKYAFTFSTAIRFIPVFAEEMSAIMEAQTARGVNFDTKNVFRKLALIAPLCVPLLITSVKKIDDSAIAAETRGFNLRTRKSGCKSYGYRLADAGAAVLSVAAIAAAVIV